jgi:hypothetical protein
MKEKLQEYALIAEIISAICIVLSLIFVGLQVRQGSKETAENSVALRSQVQQSMMEADKDLLLFRAVNKSMDQTDDFYYANALFRSRELYWTQHNVGLLDDAAYLSYMTPFVKGSLSDPAFTSFWVLAANEGYVQPGFVEEVDRLRELMGQTPFQYSTDTR